MFSIIFGILGIVSFIGAGVLFLIIRKKIIAQKLETQKVLSRVRSSEVRTGLITEKFIPLFKEFPFNPGDEGVSVVPIWQPIDVIGFLPEEIAFVEVKTGNSRLSPSQRNIKRLVEEKKVKWYTVRLKGESPKD